MSPLTRPEWADPDAARAAVRESQERQERVERQGREVVKVTTRLWALGQRNHFAESIATIFGTHR